MHWLDNARGGCIVSWEDCTRTTLPYYGRNTGPRSQTHHRSKCTFLHHFGPQPDAPTQRKQAHNTDIYVSAPGQHIAHSYTHIHTHTAARTVAVTRTQPTMAHTLMTVHTHAHGGSHTHGDHADEPTVTTHGHTRPSIHTRTITSTVADYHFGTR